MVMSEIEIIRNLNLSDPKWDRILSDYLSGLNRFDLIKIFMKKGNLIWIEDLQEKVTQLSFSLKPHEDISYLQKSFCARVCAIRNQEASDIS